MPSPGCHKYLLIDDNDGVSAPSQCHLDPSPVPHTPADDAPHAVMSLLPLCLKGGDSPARWHDRQHGLEKTELGVSTQEINQRAGTRTAGINARLRIKTNLLCQ